jgi:gluconolactonase
MSGDWTIIASGQRFPEGPLFTHDGMLWWVEVEGGGFGWHRDGETGRIATGGRPNGAAVGPEGLIWFCDQGECSIRTLDQASGLTRTIVAEFDGRRLGRPNDLIFDTYGNLIFTCPNDGRSEPTGYVCCLTPGGALTTVADGLFFANGLALLPDGRIVVAETYRQRLLIGSWDAAAPRWYDARAWVETGGPTGPDGMAVGQDGLLYVAVFGQGRVITVDPRGHIVRSFETPGSRPTNCCFDPHDPQRLIVTEAEHGRVLLLRLP